MPVTGEAVDRCAMFFNTMLGHVQTVSESAGGRGGLLRLARAWRARVMADEVVSHAFSHGFRPDHSERLGVDDI
jgi:hypothetical protein